LRKVEGTLKADIKTAMGLMVGMLTANLAEQSVLLAMKALENSNPLKLIFSGPDVKDTMEQAGKVADAATQLAKGAALLVALDDVAQDSAQLGTAFIGNKKQITSLQTVVVKIRKGDASNIGKDADLFIKEYGSYTPQTDRSSLEKNSALWSAFKDATCDLLNGEVGIAGAVPKAIAGGMLLCEKMEGTLAQFFTLREDIFNFQFQLVDAVAAVVRANIAGRLAANIKGKGDFLHATELTVGLFMMQHKLQQVASLYCDVIEYKQLGKPSSACSTVNGIFTKENVDALIAYTENAPYNEVEREVDIPTRPQFEGDTGYVDLPALARGEEVIFRLPANDKWLVTYRWTLLGQTTVTFVQSFKLFLPHKEYKTGAYRQQSTTQVIITSIAGSSVSTLYPKSGTVYILPRGHSTYLTIYEEGYNSCSKEIANPYSLCNNLPKICDRSTRRPGQSLLPTVLSTWSLRYKMNKGWDKLPWDAPSPATNLLLKAKVILRLMSLSKKRTKVPFLFPKSDIVMSQNGCCKGNRYRSSVYSQVCEPCPTRSVSRLQGLYCEINEPTK